MDWNRIAEDNRDGFQHAIVEMCGSIDKAKNFISEIKFFKFDLSNNMILFALMQEPSILTNLFVIHEAGITGRLKEHIKLIKEKKSTIKVSEGTQKEFVAMIGNREWALDFLKKLKQLGVDLTQDENLSLMYEEKESFKTLSIYYGLGFITKIIRTQQAIENILEKEKII